MTCSAQAVGLLYVGSCVAGFFHVLQQKARFTVADEREATMADFAVLVHGLPKKADPEGTMEREVQEFVEAKLGSSCPVVGVSICWDFRDRQEAVRRHTTQLLQAWDGEGVKQSGSVTDAAQLSSCEAFLEGALCGLAGGDDGDDDEEGDEETVGRQLRLMPPSSREECRAAAQGLLQDLRCSGSAFVVFRTRTEREKALWLLGGKNAEPPEEEEDEEDGEAAEPRKSPRFPGAKHRLEVKRVKGEARSILFENFGMSTATKGVRRVTGVLVVLAVIPVWAVMFYGPYAAFLMSETKISGLAMSLGGGLQATLLGFLITAGNQVVYFVILTLTARCGFHERTLQDRFYLVLYTIAVFLNTVLDLWTVLMLARGYQLDTVFVEQQDRPAIMLRAEKEPTMQESLSLQLFSYLFPGTLLLPFLLEPLVQSVVPYLLGSWVVRSRPDVRVEQAEEIMSCPEFDMGHYGDVLINISLCVLMLFVSSENLCPTFLYLVVSLLWIYSWDTWRLLRSTKEAVFPEDKIEVVAQYLLMLPLALLAACWVYRANGHGLLPGGWDYIWHWVLGATLLHCVLHVLVLRYLAPCVYEDDDPRLDADLPFEKAASGIPCTWFSANPVHCLRSNCIWRHDPPCLPFFEGKEHLLRVNERSEVHVSHVHSPRSWASAVSAQTRGSLRFRGRVQKGHDLDPPLGEMENRKRLMGKTNGNP